MTVKSSYFRDIDIENQTYYVRVLEKLPDNVIKVRRYNENYVFIYSTKETQFIKVSEEYYDSVEAKARFYPIKLQETPSNYKSRPIIR